MENPYFVMVYTESKESAWPLEDKWTDVAFFKTEEKARTFANKNEAARRFGYEICKIVPVSNCVECAGMNIGIDRTGTLCAEHTLERLSKISTIQSEYPETEAVQKYERQIQDLEHKVSELESTWIARMNDNISRAHTLLKTQLEAAEGREKGLREALEDAFQIASEITEVDPLNCSVDEISALNDGLVDLYKSLETNIMIVGKKSSDSTTESEV